MKKFEFSIHRSKPHCICSACTIVTLPFPTRIPPSRTTGATITRMLQPDTPERYRPACSDSAVKAPVKEAVDLTDNVTFQSLPNVTTLRSGLCYRKSVCLSSVCNVGAPYSGG